MTFLEIAHFLAREFYLMDSHESAVFYDVIAAAAEGKSTCIIFDYRVKEKVIKRLSDLGFRAERLTLPEPHYAHYVRISWEDAKLCQIQQTATIISRSRPSPTPESKDS